MSARAVEMQGALIKTELALAILSRVSAENLYRLAVEMGKFNLNVFFISNGDEMGICFFFFSRYNLGIGFGFLQLKLKKKPQLVLIFICRRIES